MAKRTGKRLKRGAKTGRAGHRAERPAKATRSPQDATGGQAPTGRGWKHLHARWHFFVSGNSLCGQWQRLIIGGGPGRRPLQAELTEQDRRDWKVCATCDELPKEGIGDGIRPDLNRGLTPQQMIFVREYSVDGNGTRAAIAAGYSPRTATAAASRLLRSVNVQASIAENLKPKLEAIELTEQRVLDELMSVGFFNLASIVDERGGLKGIHDWPLRSQQAIATFKIAREKLVSTDHGEETSAVMSEQIIELKPNDKVRALELLGKKLKLWVDRTEADVNVNVDAVQKKHREAVSHLKQDELLDLEKSAIAFIDKYKAAAKKKAPAGAEV